ncbi:MAG: hypothetical protein ACYTGF_07400 [Planctomycetota bacterium]|jgi:MYXO-CTERM domain-containing protein
MTSRLFVGSVVGALAAVVLLPGTAQAQPDFRMVWTAGDNAAVDYSWNDVNGQPGGFGDYNGFAGWNVPGNEAVWEGYNYTGTLVGSGQSGNPGDPPGFWTLQWNCVFNDNVSGVAGPGGAFVTANLVVTNNDPINIQNFSLLMSLPVGAIVLPEERGSVVGTVTDITFDDATVFAPVGSQIYTPRIDGVDEAPGFLLQDPFQASAGGPLQSGPVGPADFGVPVWVPSSQSIDTDIGILLSFDLTPGDSASFTAIFEVQPVPGPAALPLLAFGLLGSRRRRR